MENSQRTINKKIIIAIPCLLRGGTEMQTLLLAKALKEYGYDVEVCCFFEYDEQMVDELKAAGASVSLFGWLRNIGFVEFIKELFKYFRSKKPQVVHVQYMSPGLLPIIAAKVAQIPIVLATVHYPGTSHGILAHSLLRWATSITRYFTCVSEAAEKSWFGTSCLFDPAQQMHVKDRQHFTIPNAVDIETIDKALAEKTSTALDTAKRLEGKITIGTVARLYSEKGVDVLLKASAVIQKSVPNVHLLIVGDGVQKDYLKKLTDDLSIDDACTWLERLPWCDAMGCLDLMDIVVVPSRFEGFGLTAAEAMACSKPVVASRVDGLAEIIQDGVNGFLVTSEDVNGFAECISSLLKDKELRKKIGTAARKHVEENYSYPIFRERIRALYKAVERKTEVGSLRTDD